MKALKHKEVVSWQALSILLADNDDSPLGWRYYMSYYYPSSGKMKIGPLEDGSDVQVPVEPVLRNAPVTVREAAQAVMNCLKRRQEHSMRETLVRHEVIDKEHDGDSNVVELFPEDPPTDEDLEGLRQNLREALSSHNINPQTWSSLS